MTWSGGTYKKGNFTTNGWTGDASLGIGIEAGRHDTQDDDFAAGINQCLNKDGSNAATGNLNAGAFRVTNIGAGTARTDAAQVGQVQDGTSSYLGTTGGTATAFTVTATPTITALVTGAQYSFKANAANGVAATLKIDGTTATTMQRQGTALVGNEFKANDFVSVVYDGTNFQITNVATAPLYVDRTNNRVGIGTTTPTSALQVTGAIDSIPDAVGVHIGMSGGTNYGAIELCGDIGGLIDFTSAGVDNKGRILYSNSDNSMQFVTATTSTRLRIGGTGAVTINNVTDGVGYFNVQYDGSTDDFAAGRNITGAFYVVSKSIYDKTTVSGANVAVESTGGSYPVRRSTSSAKYKKDIVDLDPSFADKLHAFRPVFFKSKCFGDHPEWTHYGFIAEELAVIEPRFVSFGYQSDDYEDYELVDADGKTQTAQRLKADAKPEPEGVYYDRIVTFLTSVVQRQQKQLEALEARIAALEA